MAKDRAYPVPSRQNAPISILINRSAVVRKYRTCLVYHIDKGLCVVPEEATDHVTPILAQEYCLDQGGEFVQSERASDQTFTAWSSEVRKHESIGEKPSTYRAVPLFR